MEDKISEIFKKAKTIKPTSEFSERTARVILSSRQNTPAFNSAFHGFGLRFSLGAAGLVVVFALIFMAYSYLPLGGGANGHELLSEAEKIDFELHLGEAEYFEGSSRDIAAVLRKIGEPSNY